MIKNHNIELNLEVSVLLPGVPVKASRGYLGWSTVTLITPRGGEGALLCDTGSYGDRHLLQEKIRKALPPGMEVEMVVLTHLHFDHAQNVDLFPPGQDDHKPAGMGVCYPGGV